MNEDIEYEESQNYQFPIFSLPFTDNDGKELFDSDYRNFKELCFFNKDGFIDKISLRLEKDQFNVERTKLFRSGKGFFTIHEHGIYYFLNIHSEMILSEVSFYELFYWVFKCLWFNNCFKSNSSYLLLALCSLEEFKMYSQNIPVSEIELAFDFENTYSSKIVQAGEEWHKCFKTTYYTKDNKQYLNSKGKVKGNRKSFVCIYNRGEKAQANQNIVRFEYRFDSTRIKQVGADSLGMIGELSEKALAIILSPYAAKGMRKALSKDSFTDNFYDNHLAKKNCLYSIFKDAKLSNKR